MVTLIEIIPIILILVISLINGYFIDKSDDNIIRGSSILALILLGMTLIINIFDGLTKLITKESVFTFQIIISISFALSILFTAFSAYRFYNS